MCVCRRCTFFFIAAIALTKTVIFFQFIFVFAHPKMSLITDHRLQYTILYIIIPLSLAFCDSYVNPQFDSLFIDFIDDKTNISHGIQLVKR